MKSEAAALRNRIAARLAAGLTPSQVCDVERCSRTTMYGVINRLADGRHPSDDHRERNPGRPPDHCESIRAAVLSARQARPSCGPRVLWAQMRRDPAAFGLAEDLIPSASTIGRLIHAAGLARKPVGPRDKRTFPDQTPSEPGTLTIDGWGPWQIRASRLYLCTVQDRHTRLALARPVVASADLQDHRRGLGYGDWAAALSLAVDELLPGQSLDRLYADNGVGLAPKFGVLPPAAHLALARGARLIFIPPGQPWRNGRLERFHWTLEREYFRQERPSTVGEAVDGLVEFLNYYNRARPHASLDYDAPGDRWPASTLSRADLERCAPPATRSHGLVEAIRLVLNDGFVELWDGQGMRVGPVLAGQFVRVVFQVPGPGHGQVLYNPSKAISVPVAEFAHCLDQPGGCQPDAQLVANVRLLDFAGGAPPNQGLDEEQYANQRGRVAKERSWLERRLEGAADGSV